MTVRKYYKVDVNSGKLVSEKECEFKYHNGFAITQKQKSIFEFHREISKIEDTDKILEISTKSPEELGVRLSAFNLKLRYKGKEYLVENLFQSSKTFENGGPFNDLLTVSPKLAKNDQRLKTSGNLICFNHFDRTFNIEPRTLFYDWVYMSAIDYNKELARQIIDYEIFTDIEFNHHKSYNCQARSAAFYVGLYKLGKVEHALKDLEFLKTFYIKNENKEEQLSLGI